MSREHKDRPRQQIYDFVHYALPEIFFKDPVGLFKLVKESGDEFLKYLWGKMEHLSQVKEDNQNIRSELIEYGNYDLIKITLPQPEHDHESYAVALFLNKKCRRRYFVFDYRLIKNENVNLVGEWIDENFVELAKLDSPDIDQFIEFVNSIFRSASA